MSELHDLVANLSPEKRQLLELLLQEEGVDVSDLPIVPRPTDTTSVPLSFTQERLWFLDQFEPGLSVYNLPTPARLTGPLDIAALERSLNAIVMRHEALRTTFVSADGEPMQYIAATLTLPLPVADLRGLPAAEREREVQRRATAEAQRPFDLAQGPLIRTTLLQLDEEDHVILLTMHHIVSDGWSMAVFNRELSAFYNAFVNDQPVSLPELPIQYADFVLWQHQWLQGPALDQHLAYWTQQLNDLPVLALPTDRSRPAVQTYQGATCTFEISKPLTDALKAISRQEEVTLFMTLLATFNVLLHRYTGQDDIVVGSAVANRNRVEVEGLIGFFINTLVLRTDCSGNASFLELLSRVREIMLDAYAHEDLPFEKLVNALQLERDLSRQVLFQVMFVLQDATTVVLESPNLSNTPVSFDSGTSMFDLTLAMRETEQGLVGKFEYATALFEASTITRMVGHLQTVLQAIAADPSQCISDVPLLTEKERHQLLVEWNATQTDYPRDQCLHQLFEAQVARTPDTLAVVFEDERLTYGQLNDRANQLAHYLQTLGVGPDVLVGIYMERSLEMVVSLLGILKAGGAYVPLDPEYPPERVAFMLQDTQIPVLLTQERLLGRLPEHATPATPVICLDTDWPTIAEASVTNPTSGVTAEHLAYVIYTSGSTGRPKGVMNSHLGICNRLLWMQEAYGLTESDRVLQKTPFSFDVSVWEFFWPLLVGARLIMAQPGGHRDSVYLVRLIVEEEITTLHFVPSMLHAFLAEQTVETCQSLKRVMCSGEALPYELQERFFARLDAELHNLYGPTEAAVDVTYWACQQHSAQPLVPIGRPVANTQIYLLDPQQQPRPIGVPGELHIGGVQVARGYLNRSELTMEKFIPNPFSHEANTRLYKTGDLARYLPDGSIEFLGRIDHQVKIRGFRIELGEIEIVLIQHPAVQNAAVVVHENAPGDPRLVAYVMSQPGTTVETGELRHMLQQKLPSYMVPSAFVCLEPLPLTPNGKVDRRALPAPDAARPEFAAAFVAPRTPVQETLATSWAEVLGLEQVGIHDNFFELGGHSLLATQVISRVRQAFEVELPLRSLFELPTIAELSEVIEQASDSGVELRSSAIVPIRREAHRMKRSALDRSGQGES